MTPMPVPPAARPVLPGGPEQAARPGRHPRPAGPRRRVRRRRPAARTDSPSPANAARNGAGRAERVQQFFSLDYDPDWPRPQPRPLTPPRPAVSCRSPSPAPTVSPTSMWATSSPAARPLPGVRAVMHVPDPAAAEHPAEHVEHPEPHRFGARRFAAVRGSAGPRAEGEPAGSWSGDYDDRPAGITPTSPAGRGSTRTTGPPGGPASTAGSGTSEVAVVLVLLLAIPTNDPCWPAGACRQNANGLPDSGQIALVFGAMAMVLAAAMFWLIGRAAGMRAPYVPARNCARPSFLMALAASARRGHVLPVSDGLRGGGPGQGEWRRRLPGFSS